MKPLDVDQILALDALIYSENIEDVLDGSGVITVGELIEKLDGYNQLYFDNDPDTSALEGSDPDYLDGYQQGYRDGYLYRDAPVDPGGYLFNGSEEYLEGYFAGYHEGYTEARNKPIEVAMIDANPRGGNHEEPH